MDKLQAMDKGHSPIGARPRPIIIFALLAFAALEAFVVWRAASNPQGMIGGIFIMVSQHPLMVRALPVLAGTFLSLMLALVFAWKATSPSECMSWRTDGFSRGQLAVFGLLGTVAGLAAVWVLRGFPISTDEYDYIFQAKTFLAAHLYVPLPPVYDLVTPPHIIAKAGKWVSQYQPGWPLLLLAVFKLGAPFWIASPLCAGGILITLALIGAKEGGKPAAIIAVIFVGLSPFFVFNAGAYYTHIPATLFGLLFCYFGMKFIENADVKSAFLAGAALGAVGLTRTYDALIFALPFGVAFLRAATKVHYRRIPWIILGGAPFLLALMYYNRAVTGDPFTQVIQWGTTMRIGLHAEDENGRIFGLMDIVHITPLRFGEYFEWTSPAFMLLYAAAFVFKVQRRKLRFYDFILPAVVVLYMAFPSSAGIRFGPRYYFSAFPFMALTVSTVLGEMFAQGKGKPWQQKAAGGLLAAHILTCVASLFILGHFLRIVVNERMDLFDRVAAQNLHHAVVLVGTGTSGTYSDSTVAELLRDGIALDGDVIYVRADEERQGELKALFPDRRFYMYDWPPGSAGGTITPAE